MSQSNHTVQAPAFITFDYLQKMLRIFFKDKSVKVENYKVTPGTSVRVHYLGCEILRIEIVYIRKNRREKRTIIAKITPQKESPEQETKHFPVGKVEMKMMSETLPLLYKELRTKINAEPFFPYTYLSDVENRTVFMEDLKADGYILIKKASSFDLNHSLLVVKALAKMHASSSLLLGKNTDLKNDYLEFYWRKSEETFPGKVIEGSYTYLLKFLHLWPISEEDKNIFRSFEGKLFELMTETYKRRESSFNVLLHGDCWVENMMFKYDNYGEVESVRFLDYQLCNYNSIGLDINHFLFTSAKDYVKAEHLQDILRVYYDTFISITGDIEGFTFDTVEKEFKERLSFGFVLAATLRCMMIQEDRFEVEAFLEGKESPVNDKMFSNKEFISEWINILPVFKKYDVFKSSY